MMESRQKIKELLRNVNMMEGPVWCYDDHVGFKIEKKKRSARGAVFHEKDLSES